MVSGDDHWLYHYEDRGDWRFGVRSTGGGRCCSLHSGLNLFQNHSFVD